jgi:hypothetical protein
MRARLRGIIVLLILSNSRRCLARLLTHLHHSERSACVVLPSQHAAAVRVLRALRVRQKFPTSALPKRTPRRPLPTPPPPRLRRRVALRALAQDLILEKLSSHPNDLPYVLLQTRRRRAQRQESQVAQRHESARESPHAYYICWEKPGVSALPHHSIRGRYFVQHSPGLDLKRRERHRTPQLRAMAAAAQLSGAKDANIRRLERLMM